MQLFLFFLLVAYLIYPEKYVVKLFFIKVFITRLMRQPNELRKHATAKKTKQKWKTSKIHFKK